MNSSPSSLKLFNLNRPVADSQDPAHYEGEHGFLNIDTGVVVYNLDYAGDSYIEPHCAQVHIVSNDEIYESGI